MMATVTGMPLIRRSRLVVRRVVASLAMALIGFFALPVTVASAHAGLVGTSPARGSVVSQAPTQVVLTFTEGVTPVHDKIRVTAPDGSRADSGPPKTSFSQLIIPLRSGLPNGTYLVTFRVLSSDSHPVAGSFSYSIGAPSAVATPKDTNESTSKAIGVIFPVVRWFGYVGLLLMVGAALVLALLWPARLDRRGPGRVVWLGALLVGVVTIVELALQVPYVSGGSIGADDIRETLASPYGTAHLVRLGVLAASLVLLRPILQGKGWGADRVLLAVLGTIGVGTWSVTGHPGSSAAPMVTVVADMIHIGSMSVWVGGLVMLAVFLLPRGSADELAAIIPVWSRWALYAVSALVLTGLAQALVQIGAINPLFTTTYGWLVLTKVGLVAVLVAIAYLSRRLVAPIAAGNGNPAAQLRLLVIVEAVVAAVILGVSTTLVQTTPARAVTVAPNSVPAVQSAVLKDNLFTLTVDVQPGTVGANELHLYAATPDGQPADIKQWQVRASAPALGVEPIDATVLSIQPEHAVGQITIPSGGNWTFSFTLRTTDIDQSTVTTQFEIRS
jgi:copper transport protein